jgi:hypothetical protein
MRHIELTDRLYDETEHISAAAGFGSVDEYVAVVLNQSLLAEVADYGHLFTPERLAIIDRALLEVEAGDTFTSEEIREHFSSRGQMAGLQ